MITLYTFRYKEKTTGKWREARYQISIAEALERYGEGNFELLDGHTYGNSGSAAHLQRGAGES